jgi:hypothetical protein
MTKSFTEYYTEKFEPKPAGEKRFVAKHKVQVRDYPVKQKGGAPFKADNPMYNRHKMHGNNPGDDEAAYESYQIAESNKFVVLDHDKKFKHGPVPLNTALKKARELGYDPNKHVFSHEFYQDKFAPKHEDWDHGFSDEELELICDTLTVEEFEQLDELSKATLSRYASKAADQVSDSSWGTGANWVRSSDRSRSATEREWNRDSFHASHTNATKRLAGVKKAVKKLAKEGHSMSGRSDDDDSLRVKGGAKKYSHRQLRRTLNRIRESAPINEISKKLAGRYINRAVGSIEPHASRSTAHDYNQDLDNPALTGEKHTNHHRSKSNWHANKAINREQGVRLAASKLAGQGNYRGRAIKVPTREETQLDEISASKLGRYVRKSAEDIQRRRDHGSAVAAELNKHAPPGQRFGTPIDRKLYSPTASRGAGIKRAVAKLSGTAKVPAEDE